MLRHAGIVMVVMDNQQMAFQLSGEVSQVTFLVTFGIRFRGVHIAFAVHNLIVAPVDDRASGNTDFEYLRIAEQQGGGHVAAETPSVYTDALTVYIGQGFQELDAFHLVFALFDAEMAEGGVLKFQSAVAAATVVDGKHDIAFVGHVSIPSACTVLPSAGDALCVRATVDIDNGRVFLGRVEVCRFHKPVVQVGGAVGSLDGTGFDAWYPVAFIRAFCRQQVGRLFKVFGIYHVDDTRLGFRRIEVDKIGAGCVEHTAVVAFPAALEWLAHLSAIDIYGKMSAPQAFDGGEDDFFTLGVEAEHFFYKPIAFGELPHFAVLTVCSASCRGLQFGICISACIKEIEVVVTITLALINKFCSIPWQEDDWVLRFYIFGMYLFIKNANRLTCLCIILTEFGMILVTVQLNEVEAFLIRCPTDVREVTVGRIACVQINTFSCRRIVDAYLYFMAGHSRHRITYVVHFPHACSDIYKRVLCHHAFIHAVESEQIAIRTPKSTFADTKFIAMHGLTANDTFGFIGHSLVVYVQIVAYRISHIAVSRAIIFVLRSIFGFQRADNTVVLEVIDNVLSSSRE